uniref:Uncharacterized protein n=1 Tax=uncultured marine microorganism HF4000_ANIW137K11 TaxID=455533 RepID=B3T4V5_9ZZZZ|nr:hypothetical protein ALOHA_HF4000ANIW137K11ctg5g5 [uncultured marine microorganism HF4000_ANIW137K11]
MINQAWKAARPGSSLPKRAKRKVTVRKPSVSAVTRLATAPNRAPATSRVKAGITRPRLKASLSHKRNAASLRARARRFKPRKNRNRSCPKPHATRPCRRSGCSCRHSHPSVNSTIPLGSAPTGVAARTWQACRQTLPPSNCWSKLLAIVPFVASRKPLSIMWLTVATRWCSCRQVAASRSATRFPLCCDQASALSFPR